ncbi:MAG: glycosyltransferase family 87 protein [Sulfuriferula sp.]
MKISITRFILIGWLFILIGFYLLGIYFISTQHLDFAAFYASLQFLLEGKNIYTPVSVDASSLIHLPAMGEQTRHANLNPPFFTLLLSPLGWLSHQVAFLVWSFLSLIFGVMGAVLIQRTNEKPDIDYTLILLILLLAYFPTFNNIMIGQTALLVFMLVAGGWVAARQGREQLSGVLLGLAFAIKLFLGLFIIYFLLQRRWRLLVWLLMTVAATWLLGWAALGLDSYEQYHQALASVTWQSHTGNASAYGYFSRIFGGSYSIPLMDAPVLGKALYYLLTITLLALLVWLARPSQRIATIVCADLGFSFTLVAALLISPLGWIYYFPLLLIPFFVLFRLTYTYALPQKFKFSLLFVLLASGFPQLINTVADQHPAALTLAAYPFYALLGLAGLIIAANMMLQGKQVIAADTTTVERTHLLYTFLALVLYYIVMGAVIAAAKTISA